MGKNYFELEGLKKLHNMVLKNLNDLGLINQASTASFTSENITSGFSAGRMYPFNRSAIVERAFEPSNSTDQPLASLKTKASSSLLSSKTHLAPSYLAAQTELDLSYLYLLHHQYI